METELDFDFALAFAPERAPQRPTLPSATRPPVLCTADVAECTCPDFCERDHGNE
jgi:hypothetical protein